MRSGVLTSVHAFASDPARGLFILVFLALVVGGSLTLYALRAPAVRSRVSFASSAPGSASASDVSMLIILPFATVERAKTAAHSP